MLTEANNPYVGVPHLLNLQDEFADIQIVLNKADLLISDVARRIFPEETHLLIQTFAQFKTKVTHLKLDEIDLQKGWIFFWHQFGFIFRMGGAAIAIAGPATTMAFISGLSPATEQSLLPVVLIFFAEIAVAFAASAPFYFMPEIMTCCASRTVEREIKNCQIQIAESKCESRKIKELIKQMNDIANFYATWEIFAKCPNVNAIQCLFKSLANLPLSEFNRSSLALMENICAVLETGPVVDAWQALKSSPSLMEKIDAEPWLSLKLKNPSQLEYAAFFKRNQQYWLVEEMAASFKTQLSIIVNFAQGI